jgi:inhibitor of KinA sporulation pathway (predicted exonuclease)
MNAPDSVQNYIALDLELNNAQDGSTPNPKIIQVGVAIGSIDHYDDNNIITRKWYLNPNESIYPFITELTGITDEDVQTKSVSHDQLATELYGLCKEFGVYKNFVTWGGGDSTELKSEFDDRNIAFKFGGHRWIDVKTWYTLHMITKGKLPNGGLSSGLSEFKLKFQGTPHRADEDALNTLRLFFAIIERQSKIYSVIEQSKSI